MKKKGYAYSFLAAIFILLVGLTAQVITRTTCPEPFFPFNIFIGISFVILLIMLYVRFREDTFIKWLYSIPAAVSAIVLFCMLSILMGIIPQTQGSISLFGFNRINHSWPYFFSQLYLLTSLGLVTIKRAYPLKKKNIGFLLNHLGLWIILSAAGLGSGDISRFTMNLHENEVSTTVFNHNNEEYVAPFAIKLIDFSIDEYLPKVAIVDTREGRIVKKDKLPLLHQVDSVNQDFFLDSFHIRIKSIIPFADTSIHGYKATNKWGSVFACNIIINDTMEAWITPGNFMHAPRLFPLNSSLAIALLKPEVKKYTSMMKIVDKKHQIHERKLVVNKPINISGWNLYQLSYNEKLGRWSNLNIIELVRDPWLPVIYSGIILLLAGSVYIFWIGRK